MANKEGFNKESFIGRVEGKLQDKYEIVEEIGAGGFSRVLKVKNKNTGVLYACKEMQKKKLTDMEGFTREINIMIKLDHPNIIKLYEVYETETYVYIIMELCTGGELFDRIIDNTDQGKQFSEKQAASIFQQMMSAINYCHKNGIVHRDLKPENLLYLTKDANSPIKVIDFGMSKKFDKKNYMNEKVGTAYYISPEVLKGKYDEKCDVWSAGVILYIIICGYPCFNGDTDEEIFEAIIKGKIIFPSPEWDNVSDDAKNLIKKMCTSPDKRLTAEQVLKEKWVNEHAPNSKNAVLPLKADGFKNYADSSKLRKAVLTFIASRLSEDEVKNIKKIFQSIDDNNDGKLSLEEMKEAVAKTAGFKPEYIESIFKSIDTDNSGNIEYTEFIAASLEKNVYMNEQKLKDAFKLFDADNSGKISKSEISKVLNMSMNSKEVENIINKYDLNKDGEIDFKEFMNMMKGC